MAARLLKLVHADWYGKISFSREIMQKGQVPSESRHVPQGNAWKVKEVGQCCQGALRSDRPGIKNPEYLLQ